MGSTQLRMPHGQFAYPVGVGLRALRTQAKPGNVGLPCRAVERDASQHQCLLRRGQVVEQQVDFSDVACQSVGTR